MTLVGSGILERNSTIYICAGIELVSIISLVVIKLFMILSIANSVVLLSTLSIITLANIIVIIILSLHL